jgi:hypothetical protein
VAPRSEGREECGSPGKVMPRASGQTRMALVTSEELKPRKRAHRPPQAHCHFPTSPCCPQATEPWMKAMSTSKCSQERDRGTGCPQSGPASQSHSETLHVEVCTVQKEVTWNPGPVYPAPGEMQTRGKHSNVRELGNQSSSELLIKCTQQDMKQKRSQDCRDTVSE